MANHEATSILKKIYKSRAFSAKKSVRALRDALQLPIYIEWEPVIREKDS